MQPREIEFVVGVETSTTPTAGTPSVSTDLITLGALGSLVEGRRVGSTSTTLTLASTPNSLFPLNLRKNGQRLLAPDDYSRSGATVTLTEAPTAEDVFDWDYRA